MLRFDAVPESVSRLLRRLAPNPALADFALGGGTSLALRFGHRLSVDLDYFTTLEFSPDDLLAKLALEETEVINRAENSLSVNASGVKLDLLRHAYPQLAPAELISEVALVSLQDLAAMKLNAIANRGSKKDFYDVAELLKHFTLPEMLGFFSEKYPGTDSFTVIRSLAWFQDAEEEPDPKSLVGSDWDDVKLKVGKAVGSCS
jgi:hypothetical protein